MGCVMLALWIGVVPICAGGLLGPIVDNRKLRPGFLWISGTMLLWAGFQMICVPFVLRQHPFTELVRAYAVCGGVAAAAGLVRLVLFWRKNGAAGRFRVLSGEEASRGRKVTGLLWAVAVLLVLTQLVLSVTMTYSDGDDAFYVAVSSLTVDSDTMYQKMPYNMGNTGLDVRHGLAPFPIWIAFLSRVSGISTVAMAHVAVSTVLIFMTYVIFYQIGRVLFGARGEALPVFLSLTALLVMFGDYSYYTAENFMIARSRQGKAALGNIIIPMVILIFLLIFQRLKDRQKTGWGLWILLGAAVTAACLCSTLGTFLICLFLGVIGLCAGIVYRSWGLIWRTALCCIPAVAYALLYFLLV